MKKQTKIKNVLGVFILAAVLLIYLMNINHNWYFADILKDAEFSGFFKKYKKGTRAGIKAYYAKIIKKEKKLVFKDKNLRKEFARKKEVERELRIKMLKARKNFKISLAGADQKQTYKRLWRKKEKERKKLYLKIKKIELTLQYIRELINLYKTQNLESRVLKKHAKIIFNLDKEKQNFIWPVFPFRGIAAFFKDKGYKKRYGKDHGAIDIPVPSNTKVRAAKNGKIIQLIYSRSPKVYNYIVIEHKNGIKTFYGHILKPLVKKGQKVSQGQAIGLSGGLPGTAGAWVSTGEHLHFEIIENGKKKDPLKFLDLRFVPLFSLQDKYRKEFSISNFFTEGEISRADFDSDNLANAIEAYYETDPYSKDSDGDGRSDWEEVVHGYNPLGDGFLDSDGDGVPDREEALIGTDYMNIDTDKDGLTDKEELAI